MIVCDKSENNFKEKYYSFIIYEGKIDKLRKKILKYIEEKGKEVECDRLYDLANTLKDSLLHSKWIDKNTEILLEEYD